MSYPCIAYQWWRAWTLNIWFGVKHFFLWTWKHEVKPDDLQAFSHYWKKKETVYAGIWMYSIIYSQAQLLKMWGFQNGVTFFKIWTSGSRDICILSAPKKGRFVGKSYAAINQLFGLHQLPALS